MYDNIGNKIKKLAKIVFIVEAICAIIAGIALMANGNDLVVIGLLMMLGGPFIAWVSSWLMYGYGQLIENSDRIADGHNGKQKLHQKPEPQKMPVVKNDERRPSKPRKEVKVVITNPDAADDGFVDLTCTNCDAELSFTKEQIQNPDGLICPMCDAHLSF